MNRQICGLLASEDAINVASRTPKPVERIGSVRPQATQLRSSALVDGWQFVLGSKPDDQIAMNERQPAPGDNQAAARAARESRNRTLDHLIRAGEQGTEAPTSRVPLLSSG